MNDDTTELENIAGIHMNEIKELREKLADMDGLYSERAHLVAFIARLYPSSLERVDSTPGFEFAVYIDSPRGQLSWHIADVDLPLFNGISRNAGRIWDNHGTTEKLSRLDMIGYECKEGEIARLTMKLGVMTTNRDAFVTENARLTKQLEFSEMCGETALAGTEITVLKLLVNVKELRAKDAEIAGLKEKLAKVPNHQAAWGSLTDADWGD